MKDCFKCLIYIEEEEVNYFLEFLRLDMYKKILQANLHTYLKEFVERI